MKTILISIHPKWCEKIFSGEKTIEVRKTAPKPPFKAIVYETFNGGGSGKVIGEFICNDVYERNANKRRRLGYEHIKRKN